MLTQISFLVFVLSGFCGLLYQVVWLRLAFSAFGIVTPVLSVVVSVFMLGLALGSWGAGRGVNWWVRRTGLSPIYLYAAAEVVIGVSAFLVPWAFTMGQRWLLSAGQTDSFAYLALSALIIGISLMPPCLAMGATFPLVLAFLRGKDDGGTNRFSFLYLANVLGASLGALVTAVALVELFGFRGTLRVAAIINLSIAAVAIWLGRRYPLAVDFSAQAVSQPLSARTPKTRGSSHEAALIAPILFVTGFSSMALEVIWTRAFTTVLGTYVYSFAGLLFTYLWATWVGSWMYRRDIQRGSVWPISKLIALLAVTSFLPIVVNDPRVTRHEILLALGSIVPFCGLLGYLTPSLIDRYSGDEPRLAGKAYAINVIGSVLGPLVAGYVVLPALGARFGMLLFVAPFPILFGILRRSSALNTRWHVATVASSAALVLWSVFVSVSYEEGPPGVAAEIRRDHSATVVSFGEGMQKQLLVNGIGITSLTPLTKLMAHMPLAIHGSAKSIVVICLGMGTTYRSAMSWGIDTTAVDLTPSVRDAFPYYFDDAVHLMNQPSGRIVIDDGRRFLQRSARRFDVVTIDPPPPLEAAGSSLLYSTEFYDLIKLRLNPGGILQQWSPGGDVLSDTAIARALVDSFAHVIAFRAVELRGTHYVASMQPIRIPTAEEFVARLPESAQRDLVEWNTGELRDPHTFVVEVLKRKIPVDEVLGGSTTRVVVTDDLPYNEYYLLRRAWRAYQR
jgi:spermidine synthase